MCRTYNTTYASSCGHRFTPSKIPCFYESHRDDSQPVCRFIISCHLRWDENGETHCEDCREEIRKARPGRALAAKREQLEAYELGIAEYMKNIEEHEEIFRRIEAEDDSSVEASSSHHEDDSDPDKATALTDKSFGLEHSTFEKDLVSYTPATDQTFGRELSPYEKELINYQDIEAWIQGIKGDWQGKGTQLNVRLAKAQTKSLSANVESDKAWQEERRHRQVELARMFMEAEEQVGKKLRREKHAKLKTMFAEARAKAS